MKRKILILLSVLVFIACFSVMSVSAASSAETTPGDANGDKLVNGKDITVIRRYNAGYSVEIDEEAANVNGDYVINGKDITAIRRFNAGYAVTLLPPPAPHAHLLTAVDARAASCTGSGNIAYWSCSICQRLFADEGGEQALRPADVITPKLEHIEAILPAKPSSCTESGLTEGASCSVCGTILKAQQVIEKSGHSEIIDAGKAPTCTEAGLTEGKHCTVCGEVTAAQQAIPAAHNYGETYSCLVCRDERPATEGLKYELIKNNTAYSVTHLAPSEDGVAVIPAVYSGLPVVAIGYSNEFSVSGSIRGILIPAGVTRIDSLFINLVGELEFITVASGNKIYHSESGCLIQTAGETLVAGVPNCSIPTDGTVTKIGRYAFMGCASLQSIAIPKSVAAIDSFAFSGSGLSSITYSGTKANWNSIDKAENWAAGMAECTVICTDGKITVANDTVVEQPIVIPVVEDGLMVYHQDFESVGTTTTNSVTMSALGWTIDNSYKTNTAAYTVSGGKLSIKNYDGGSISGKDSYVLLLSHNYMTPAARLDYTLQFDVKHIDSAKTDRYIALLTNYAEGGNYISFHLRTNGFADYQPRTNGSWGTRLDNNSGEFRSANQDESASQPSIAKKLLNVTFDETKKPLEGRELTVKIQFSNSAGPTVWLRDNSADSPEFICVSKPSVLDKWHSREDYAVALKVGGAIDAEVDNIAIWTGLGDEPADKTDTAYKAAIAAYLEQVGE